MPYHAKTSIVCGILLATIATFVSAQADAGDSTQTTETKTKQSANGDAAAPPKAEELPALDKSWKAMFRAEDKSRIWIHSKKKQVAIAGEICLTRGFLELFACMKNTKDHESVVALQGKAELIHAALLAVGAKPGKPAVWRPAYRPASGEEIQVSVEWMEKRKRKVVSAQQLVRNLRTKKAMTHPWVFCRERFLEGS